MAGTDPGFSAAAESRRCALVTDKPSALPRANEGSLNQSSYWASRAVSHTTAQSRCSRIRPTDEGEQGPYGVLTTSCGQVSFFFDNRPARDGISDGSHCFDAQKPPLCDGPKAGWRRQGNGKAHQQSPGVRSVEDLPACPFRADGNLRPRPRSALIHCCKLLTCLQGRAHFQDSSYCCSFIAAALRQTCRALGAPASAAFARS